ncbi:glutamine synthetase family protein [Novosphingobium sp. Fuku2-ISO-50]|uniref:glutamine synthetase family protein n=1 Tax=Novosphingobium sp. Fuku2-ISO-50 TaxID=1739114 RepID=UPI00076D6938|nr:glutamine synthetase family protein [Novosphingobium sp. Fuku2-ISO-50]KUR77072.1 glutamine synthetase [Novosphingobium sp. Fuku2-ISO-50]
MSDATKVQTDIERTVADPARQDLVRQVRARIDALGIRHVYFQFVSVTGRVMGKSVPSAHWEAIAAKGVQLWYGAVADVTADRRGNYIGYSSNAAELIALPDPETFVQLPWNKQVARVFCTLFRHREEDENPGGFLSSDCRGNLKRIHADFKARHGLELRLGCEPEMMWLKRGPNGEFAGGTTKPLAYHIDQFEQLSPVIMRVHEYAEAMGLDMIQGDHEDAPGQLELNFMYDDVLRTADRLTTYRQICAQVAREFNLIATFMTKPFQGVSANGCHHNVSLWEGGEDVVNKLGHDSLPGGDAVFTYRKGGRNAFLRETGEWLPDTIGLQCIGGLIEHLPALTAIGSSTVNSYRRMSDTGYWAPIYADWGMQNRTVGIRVSAPGRVEYRAVDSLVNPYLMGAGLLKAFDDGIVRDLDPGAPEQRNIYEALEAGKEVRRLPTDLRDALDALAVDPVILGAMPGDMERCFFELKRDEWDRFMATVTSWDYDRFLEFLP